MCGRSKRAALARFAKSATRSGSLRGREPTAAVARAVAAAAAADPPSPRISTPEATSTPIAGTSATASPTFDGSRPPARMTGISRATAAAIWRAICWPVPPGNGPPAVSRMSRSAPAARYDLPSSIASASTAGALTAGEPAVNAPAVLALAIELGKSYLAAGAERLILDTAGGPFPGGTGQQIARQMAAAVAREIPVILAGGLDPSNVGDAVAEVPAIGVDVSAGAEMRGEGGSAAAAAATARATAAVGSRPRKDPLRVALFAKRARAARFDRPHIRPRPTPVPEPLLEPDEHGKWGLNRDFGGRYVPETLIAALDQLQAAWNETRHDPRF